MQAYVACNCQSQCARGHLGFTGIFDAQQYEECRKDCRRSSQTAHQRQGVEEVPFILSICVFFTAMLNSYIAATEIGFHARSFRGDMYDRENCPAPEAAIWYRMSAEKRSSVVNSKTLVILPISVVGDGRKENNGNKSGAFVPLASNAF